MGLTRTMVPLKYTCQYTRFTVMWVKVPRGCNYDIPETNNANQLT
jgi:hypothetical protein